MASISNKSRLIVQHIRTRFRKQWKTLLIVIFILFFVRLYWSHIRYYTVQSLYFTRPFWDKPERPFHIQPHYYTPGLTDEQLCRLHRWEAYSLEDDRPLVYDAILFSIELDLLEIRLRELQDVVDMFLIVESNVTFTGKPKPLLFEKNKDRFRFVEEKIRYKAVSLRPPKRGENPFDLEGQQRGVHMNALIDEVGIQQGHWILMMDVDEIPYAHTIRLLKACKNVPSPIQFQLKNYLYSFEFLVDMDSWRGRAVKAPCFYGHNRVTDTMLADAGWHCSFCFRYIRDFIFKMSAYSHADRIHSPYLLNPDRIQEVICRGGDIYDMIPEAHTYRDLIAKWGDIPKSLSGIGLPDYVVKNAERFSYLLPGGCQRQKQP